MLTVGETYVTRSGQRVLILEFDSSNKWQYTGAVVYDCGTAVLRYNSFGTCSNRKTSELDIVLLSGGPKSANLGRQQWAEASQ
jgi:hypothetical protein